MNHVAETFFNYLRDVIYAPANAVLEIEKLPEDFQKFGIGLRFFAECVMETNAMAHALAKGDLSGKVPSSDNELASPLKSLHASLRHLTWQTQQVAKGDYRQSVDFMGDFAAAFNSMAGQLEERKKLEIKERSRLQQYINLILLNTPSILLVFDTEGKAVLASEAYLRCTDRLSIEEIQGKSFEELFASVSNNGFLSSICSLFEDALANKQLVELEQSIDFKQDGNLRTYIIHITPMLDENNTVIGTMIVFHDMTEIKQAQHEAEHARELAEQSTRAKSDFLSRMTHEIRTPMSAIIGMTSIGKDAPNIEKKDYSLRKIEEASKHLLGVINDILDMSKIEADKFELSYSEFSFNKMLDHVKSIISLHVAEKEQIFTVDIDDSIPLNIVSDEQHLSQILTNLLSNAVKFTPKHGSIALTVLKTMEKDGVCTIQFKVKDTGIGISDEQQTRLFVPFEQADGSVSRKFGGTGLGLSISKRIVEMMDGNIWVESEPGEGSSFIFNIKALAGTENDIDEEATDVHANGSYSGKKILIAEDVDINREIILALLENTGIEIDFAVNGKEAVEKYTSASNEYVLILMDIQMPEMDGYEATRCIRSSSLPEAEKIPIIAMTANVFREDVERCLAAGMNDHLGKPINIDEVITSLNKYIA